MFSCLRLQQLDEENGELRSCTPCLKANIERLEEVSGQLGALSVWGPAPRQVGTPSARLTSGRSSALCH